MKLKKTICLILATLTLALCFAGCSGKESDDTTVKPLVPINPAYTEFFYVTDGVVGFKNADGKIGLIDSSITEVLAAEYTEIKYCEAAEVCILTKADGTTVSFNPKDKTFTEDVCAHGGFEPIVWDSTKGAPVDGFGEPLSESAYPENVCFVYDSASQKYGIIDSEGKLVVSPLYDDVGDADFSDSIAAVKKDGVWGYINASGEEVIGFYYSAAYTSVSCLENGEGRPYAPIKGEVVVYREGYFVGIYSEAGELLCKFSYRDIIPFGDGNYVAKTPDGKWYSGNSASLAA